MAEKLILMMGIPGAGKSTLIKQQVDPHTDVIVSRDAIRLSILKDSDAYFTKEKEVWREYVETLKLFLANDNIKTVYADATHLNVKSRRKILMALEPFLENVDIYVLYVKVDLSTAFKQNAQRKGRALVPEDTIREMYHSLQVPSEKEGFYEYAHYGEKGNKILYRYKKEG